MLQSLAVGQTITQVYTVTIKDNNGAHGDAGRHGDDHRHQRRADHRGVDRRHAGRVTEDSASRRSGGGGTITFQDLDLIDTHTATFALKSSTSSAHLPGFTEGNAGTSATSAHLR